LPFKLLNIQIKVLIIQRTTCLYLQRAMLSKPVSPGKPYWFSVCVFGQRK
jgi:hypothetical protein